MTQTQRNTIWLSLFAIAMAYVEAALVVHLRSLYYPDNPQAIFPLSLLSHRDLTIELARELATIVMIICVAMLVGRGFLQRFAAFVYIFGLWDIFYYIWLKIMIDWPQAWLEWDVLFLIPWPWFGPWIAAALIALLFVIWSGWVLLAAKQARLTRASMLLFTAGTLMCLSCFLLPAVPLLVEGEEAFRGYQPDEFLWPLYSVGYLLMVMGLWRIGLSKTMPQELNKQ